MDDIEKSRQAVGDWYLGQTSASHETGGRGPATISTGEGDHGGPSYGSYQLSSSTGTLNAYLRQSRYQDEFNGLEPVTLAFDARWRELAPTDPGFGQDQHDYIRRTHYDVQVVMLKDAGIDVTNRGRAIQDAVWSTAVQFGPRRNIINRGLEEKFGKNYDLSKLTDVNILEAVQDYKIAHNEELFRSSPRRWASLLKRAQEEKAELIELATREEQLVKNSIHIPLDLAAGAINHEAPSHRHAESGSAIQQLQKTLTTLGYTDAHGRALTIDGDYDHRTREAVQMFQHDHGLAVDGIAGPVTLAAVREAVVHIPSIGQPDAPYLHHPQQTDALADYRAFAPATVPHFTSVSPTAVTGVEPPSITFPTVSASLDAPAVRHLQENLNALGMTNCRLPANQCHAKLEVAGSFLSRNSTGVSPPRLSWGISWL